MNVLNLSKTIIKKYCKENYTCIDFTAGNGNDSVFLSNLLPKGKLYSFDIQQKAIDNTEKLLKQNSLFKNFTIIKDGHENVDKYIKRFNIGIYNLGYLPGYNQEITTKTEKTFESIKKACNLLERKGFFIIIIYRGHLEGKREEKYIEQNIIEIEQKKFDIYKYQNINKKNSPYMIMVKKK